jgi:transcriptional regulator with XRE-family HTH domain
MVNTIKSLREAKGWSISELARRARVHPSDMSRIESGRALPYKPQLVRLARVLGVGRDELATIIGNVTVTTEARAQ